MGFYLSGAGAATDSSFGFTSLTATDGTAQGSPSFTISPVPGSLTAAAGSTGTYTVSVTPSGGFTGTVGLSVAGLPQGATASFNPASVTTSGASVVTVRTASSTPAASYPLTFTGTGGSLNNTATATLVVSNQSGSSSSCDLNKDGTTNVVDVQIATNNYLACTSGPNASNSAFVTQVVNSALGQSCTLTAGAHTVVLNWTASTTSGALYNVYRATSSGAYTYTTPLNSTPIAGTSLSDCTALSGQTYYYVVTAVDGGGNQSTISNETAAAVPTP
jgi:hypothetical protein